MTGRERLRVWEIGCPGVDAILWTSFEWDELLNLDAFFVRVKNKHAKRAFPNDTIEHLVFAAAHEMCHWENSVSNKIQRYLEVMHSKAVEGPNFARVGQTVKAFSVGSIPDISTGAVITARAKYIGDERGGTFQLVEIAVTGGG